MQKHVGEQADQAQQVGLGQQVHGLKIQPLAAATTLVKLPGSTTAS